MADTRIEWAQKVWNPVTGCTKISSGCQNCYAERMAKRLRGRCGYPADDPFRVTLHPERLNEPLKWKTPRRVFVCSMGDLFHEDVPHEFIDYVFAVMGRSQQHTFILLTKRPERMREYLQAGRYQQILNIAYRLKFRPEGLGKGIDNPKDMRWWPNVWLGVTAENQQHANERIPILLQIPAAVRFVSVEPMLGPVDLSKWLGGTWYCETCECTVDPEFVPFSEIHYPCENYLDFIPGIDWVICGGETGPHARPVHPDWVRNLRDQCQEAGTSFFFKSWGKWMPANNSSKARDGLWVHENGDTFGPWEGEPFNPTATAQHMVKVGKQAAGRLLDGREWNEMPGRPVK